LHILSSIDDAKALEGVEVGVSDWIVVDQHRIDQFAEATADYQWIHVDTERAAREMPGGKTIAVPVGAKLRASATVLQARRRAGALLLTSEVRLEVEGERKPACVAETLGMYFFKD
jgi:acyl dehydratase